ncbi:MAG: hypothetical protein WBM13_06270, partial [Bacteroidia bacterium]
MKTLIQDNPSLAGLSPSQQYKKIDYLYDLVSGKVNEVKYQDGELDAFYHKYEYDADNRITNVITSKDGVIWDKEANYFYYQHGPLARVELGDQKVQAMDYAYTIQGWIKGVNSNTLKETRDIGKDGETTSTNLHQHVGRDAAGYSLNYFNGDYASIATLTNNFIADESSASYINAFAPNLYNGNISHMVTAINDLTTPSSPVVSPQLTAYKYDQLNRINDMKAFRNISLAGNAWQSSTGEVDSYRTSVTYDANGNILTLNRQGVYGTSVDMDLLEYKYENISNSYTRNTNKLRYVTDAASSGNYATDIDNQSANNYEYDEIGNLIADAQEQIDNIEWTVYGKIKSISRTTGSTKPDLVFNYDASGNRISKTMIPRDGSGQRPTDEWVTTYYVRDAQGNVMSTYEKEDDTYKLKEQLLYGSSRLGTLNRDIDLVTYTPEDVVSRTAGKKTFEITNHLGSVITTVSDRKLGVDVNTDNFADYYTADILSATDYYSHGSV